MPTLSWEIRMSERAICSWPVLAFGTAMSQVMTTLLTAQLLLLAILMLTITGHGAQALRPAADEQRDSTGAFPHDLGSPVFSSAGKAHGADGVYMHDVEPFEVLGATVHGPVSSRTQQDLLQQTAAVTGRGSRRVLLHGSHMAKMYPRCNKCKMVECNLDNFCSGHCRSRGLKYCSSATVGTPQGVPLEPEAITDCSNRNSDAADSVPFTVEDVTGLPASDMGTYDTAVVTVPAPYIGCAEIGNRPSGCPAPGTGAMRRTVVASRCNSEVYIPDCPGPLMPFGVCECAYEFRSTRPVQGSRPRPATEPFFAPCRTTELAAGSGVGGSDGSESDEGLVVVPAGAITQTWFSNFTSEGDVPDHTHTVTAATILGDVNATLTYYRAIVTQADSVSPEVEISEDSELTYDEYYTILIPTPAAEQ